MPSVQLKFGLVTASLFAFGWLSAWSFSQYQNPGSKNQHLRAIASVKAKSTLMMEKHLTPVHVEIIAPDLIPEGPGEDVTIKAFVRTPFESFSQITYQWILPSDVEVVKGHQSDTIVNPVANQNYEVEITLRNFDKQYRKDLTLKATILESSGAQLVNTSVITSRPEDSMEHLAPMMMVKAQEFEQQNRMPASEQ